MNHASVASGDVTKFKVERHMCHIQECRQLVETINRDLALVPECRWHGANVKAQGQAMFGQIFNDWKQMCDDDPSAAILPEEDEDPEDADAVTLSASTAAVMAPLLFFSVALGCVAIFSY